MMVIDETVTRVSKRCRFNANVSLPLILYSKGETATVLTNEGLYNFLIYSGGFSALFSKLIDICHTRKIGKLSTRTLDSLPFTLSKLLSIKLKIGRQWL